MIRASLPRRAALAAAALLAVLACRAVDLAAPTSVLSPEPATLRRDDATSGARRPRTLATCTARPSVSASGVFGARGGVLRIGATRLVIPPGALHKSVRITGTTRAAGGAVDFQPEGLRFRRAATLVLDATGCATPAGAVPAVVYLGPDGEILETIEASFERGWREVVAPIVHFSGYGILF